VQGELRALADDTAQQQQRADDDGAPSEVRGEHVADPKRPGADPEREDPEHEADVAEPRGEERLDGGGSGVLVFPVVPDEQVGADAHDLPADEQHEQVGGEDDDEHRGGEQGDDRGVRRVARVALHVADGVELDEHRDDGHHQRDRRGQPVDAGPGRDRHIADREQLVGGFGRRRRCPDGADDERHGEDGRGQGGEDRERAGAARQSPPEQQAEHRRGERQRGQQPGVRAHAAASVCSRNSVASSTWTLSRLR
jgi:hypothetical protein